MSSSPETMTNVDTAWWHMERPTNLMMITGIMTLSAPIEFDRMKQIFEQRFLRFDRFRQRVVDSRALLSSPQWEFDPHFDIRAHLHRVALPAPGDQTALQELVSDLMSTSLDYTKPLWSFHLVENVGDGCALVGRLHHCIADGIALVRVLLSLTDDAPDAVWVDDRAGGDHQRGLLSALLHPAVSAVKSTWRMTENMLHEGIESVLHPTRVLDMARLGASGAARLAKIALYWPDPQTIFKGELGVTKRAAWTAQPISLTDVKAVGKATGSTVNDVLLTAVAGALRRYLLDRGEAVDGLNIRALVPVNLRPLDKPIELGNRFGLVFLSLPVGIEDQLDRLFELKKRMDEIKGSPEAVVALGVLHTMGMTPVEIENLILRFFASKSTAVMTNVPGPREPLYFAGAPVESIMAWVPQSGRLGLGVSIFSYAGNVSLGITTDAGLVPDPDRIITHFYDEFTQMQTLLPEMQEAQTPAPPTTAVRCQGVTQSGRQCRNMALPGANFCRLHQSQAEPVAALDENHPLP